MDLAALRQAGQRLRRPSETHDTSGPKLTGYITEDEIGAYQNTVLDANIEQWAELLGDATFPTVFVPLTKVYVFQYLIFIQKKETGEKKNEKKKGKKRKMEKRKSRL